jgi:hypothetical protein
MRKRGNLAATVYSEIVASSRQRNVIPESTKIECGTANQYKILWILFSTSIPSLGIRRNWSVYGLSGGLSDPDCEVRGFNAKRTEICPQLTPLRA